MPVSFSFPYIKLKKSVLATERLTSSYFDPFRFVIMYNMKLSYHKSDEIQVLSYVSLSCGADRLESMFTACGYLFKENHRTWKCV